MVFAQRNESYKGRDFKVESCLAWAGPTNVSELDVSLCSVIHESEKSRVSEMFMNDHVVSRGGTPKTRNELLKHRTAVLNEAKETKSAIRYRLTSLWSILETLYVGRHNENFIRAVNLDHEYYYLGFLNHGCYYRSSN